MAEKTLKTTILLRNDTSANWEAKDPILKEGEAGVDLTTGKIKIGNGTAHWNDLKFVGGDAAQNFEAVPQEGEDDVAAITRVVGTNEVHNGDTAIVKRTISGDKLSYTAYVYDGAWKAMDGNYRADNVYFDDDITYTVAIGTLAKPSGSAKFAAAGKSVEQVLSSLMAQEANPSKTNPAVSFSTQTGFGTFEIGTKKNLAYTAALSAGSYTYGPATGVSATSYSVADGVAGHEAQTGATGTFPELQVVDNTNYKLTATIAHGAGANPKNNLEVEVPSLAIKAGNKTATSDAITGYRSVFAGASVTPIAIDSTSIRGLKGKTGAYTASFNLAIPEGCTQVVIALPNGHTVKKVEDVGAFGTDIFSVFVKQTAQVEGANNYTAAAYNVYVYTPASALGANTYRVTCA